VFSTTTTKADPGAGNFRFDNATWGSITEIYIDTEDNDGNDQSSWIASWDDSDSSVQGYLEFYNTS